jgi:hypothetical protein
LSQPVQVEAVDPAPPGDFVTNQAGLPEDPEMAANSRSRDGKQGCDITGVEIAAGQGGHDLPAGRVSHCREHIHSGSVTAQLRIFGVMSQLADQGCGPVGGRSAEGSEG